MHYNNLLLIQNLEEDYLISYSKNKLYVDDRYFASYRPSYNINKVVLILRNSFLYFLKIYEIENDNINIFIDDSSYNTFPSILGFIQNSLECLDKLINNKSYSKDDKKQFTELKSFINESLKAVNKKYSETDTEDEGDSESFKYSNNETKNNSFLNNIMGNFLYGVNYIRQTGFEAMIMVENFFSDSYDYIIGLVN